MPRDFPDIQALASPDNVIVELKELVASNVLLWIPASSVKSIFFVCYYADGVSNLYIPHGIKIAGYIRRCRVRAGILSDVTTQEHETFVRNHLTISERLFSFLTTIREEICKALSMQRIFLYPNMSVIELPFLY